MDKKQLDTAKIHVTFGTIALIAGIALIFMGQKLMGISGAIVGAGLAFKGLKTIKESKNG
jgi:hypothetical protein